MTRIENLNDDQLLRAYNEIAKLLGQRGTTDLGPTGTAQVRLEAILSEAAGKFSVTLKPDGSVYSEALPVSEHSASTELADPASGSRIVHTPSEARVSPGLARMRARLGADGAEELRRKVASDGEASLQAAAKRPDAAGSGVDWTEAGGTAAESAATTTDPAYAKRVSDAVAAKSQHPMEITKRLSKETDPKIREILKAALKIAEQREAGAPKKATQAPAPRAAAPRAAPGSKSKVADPTDVITLLATTNPKRSTAGERFAKYRTGMTVAEYTAEIGGDAAKAARDIAWDRNQGWITVAPAEK